MMMVTMMIMMMMMIDDSGSIDIIIDDVDDDDDDDDDNDGAMIICVSYYHDINIYINRNSKAGDSILVEGDDIQFKIKSYQHVNGVIHIDGIFYNDD